MTTHWHYTYDSVGRLTEVNKDGTVVESYDYDANGNRVRTTSTLRGIYDQSATYTVEDAIEQVGGDTYVYDEDGWLSSKITGEGTTHYSYGTLGELTSVVKPDGTTIEYVHNVRSVGKSQLLGFFSFGTRGDVGTTAGGVQRTAKKVNGTVTEKYLWLDLTTLLAVYDGSGNLVSRFEYADSRMPYKMTQGGQTYYLNYDQVGTLRTVAAQDGTIVKTIEYDTFGNVLSDSNPSLKMPFGFAGGLYDPDTKLTRFGYRDYDAETGKWTAKDPIAFSGGDTNLYGYVLGDPINLVDIYGLNAMNDFLNGMLSVPLGLYDLGYQLGRLNGNFGVLEKYTAEQDLHRTKSLIDLILKDKNVRKQFGNVCYELASNNKAYLSGRLLMGPLIGIVSGSKLLGLGVAGLAIGGNGLNGSQVINDFARQLILGY